MSAKILIKKEDLIKGAIKIIRSKGHEELSARNLARVCNCSNNPICIAPFFAKIQLILPKEKAFFFSRKEGFIILSRPLI